MSESIGSLYPTKVPSLSDPASIQEAFRIYHYGADSGSGVGEYDINNTDPESLINPSIAYSLHDLQSQITDLSAVGSIPLSAFTTKGALLVGTGSSTYVQFLPATNGYLLKTNSGTASGLEWALPDITLTNAVTLTNKTLTAPVINLGFNNQTTSYTLALSDNGKIVEIDSSSAQILNVPTNATAFPIGAQITITQVGTGQVTIAASTPGTTTINSSSGLKLRTQWSTATLVKRENEKWLLTGDLSA